jgi:hypothetical protein
MSTQSMQAIRVHTYGAPDQLKLEQAQRPGPQAGEELIRVCSWGQPFVLEIASGLDERLFSSKCSTRFDGGMMIVLSAELLRQVHEIGRHNLN